MTHTDPIADMLVRIKNASARKHAEVEMPSSKIKIELAAILKRKGFIKDYEYVQKEDKQHLNITLQYFNKMAAFQDLKRVSKPGQRIYSSVDDLTNAGRSNQTVIVSTSSGLMTLPEAKAKKVGGEVICRIW
jgi:small subunit ribosomal protein S8